MNLMLSCVGKRGYIADYFRPHLDGLIVGTSNTEWTPGFAAVDIGEIVPDIGTHGHLERLLALCSQHEVRGLLSFFDLDVAELSKHRADFEAAGVLPFLPPAATAAMCLDKWLCFQELGRLGFRVPYTTIDLDEALDAVRRGTLSYPVWVKPRYGFGSANTFLAHNDEQVRVFFTYADDMLIQESCPGDAYNVEVLCDLQGQALAAVPWRKELSRMGETERAYTVRDERILTFGTGLAEAIGLVGPMDADLFVDGDDIWVLEINPRFGGGYPVSHFAGAGFPELIVAMMNGEQPAPRIGSYREDVAMMKTLTPIGGPREELFKGLVT